MSAVAILPIKSFTEAKQRLADHLPAGARRALVEAMFSDVLVALRRSSAVVQLIVVTRDTVAQQVAGGYGATVLDEQQPGHSAAALVGIARAARDGAERVLLVPGDCPLLAPAELDALIGRPAPPRSTLVVPDRHGAGTNALLLTPPDAIEPAFGPGSRERHVQRARERGSQPEVVEVPSLGLDIDTPEDLAELETRLSLTRGGAARTRGMLTQLSRSAPR